jgi:hypothetical protein
MLTFCLNVCYRGDRDRRDETVSFFQKEAGKEWLSIVTLSYYLAWLLL